MKRLYKVLSSLTLVGLSIVGLVSCNNKETSTTPVDSNTTSNVTTTPQTPTTSINGSLPEGHINYVVKTQALSGLPLAGVRVKLSKSGEEDKTGYSNEYGEVNFQIPSKGNWSISCTDIDGYTVDEDYEGQITDISAGETVIKFKPHLLDKNAESTFKVNSQMVDYTFNGYDYSDGGKAASYTLSDLFENGTELVCLNFWYTTCSWCIREFPYMLESYQIYEPKGVKIIGINPGSSQNDDKSTVDSFAATNDLNFLCTIEDTTMITNFEISGYPTSVFIDRYGTITLIEGGAVTSTEKWNSLFEKYIGDDYVPTYESSGSNIKPDTVFPGSDALKNASVSGDLAVTFKNETRDGYEFNWSWEVSEDGMSIKPSNEGINSSYSILWMNVTVPAGKVLALDYKASSDDNDFLGILFDNKAICQLSGKSSKFSTQYLYVAGDKDENIDIEFFFYKDSSGSLNDDTIYINNIRLIEQTDINGTVHIIRQAAYGDINSLTQKWTNYITPVYNEVDGYYHVGNENGPLLLAALIDTYTHFASNSISEYIAYDPEMFVDKDNNIDYGAILSKYASFCQNSTLSMMDLPTNGLTPITKELKEALDFAVVQLSDMSNEEHPEQWLELCVYIEDYGDEANKIGNPIIGLATFSAFDSTINYDTETSFEDKEYNYVKFDFALVPRGYLFKVTPTKSGVYHIYGATGSETICFFYTDEGERVEDTQAYVDRDIYKMYDDHSYAYVENCYNDFTQYMYYEAGKTYYIAPSFFYTDEVDLTLRFYIDYVGPSYKYLAQASEGMFTYEETNDGSIGNIISISNVEVQLGNDGYYHPVKDGSLRLEEFIYADFLFTTSIFSEKSLYDRAIYFKDTDLSYIGSWVYKENNNIKSALDLLESSFIIDEDSFEITSNQKLSDGKIIIIGKNEENKEYTLTIDQDVLVVEDSLGAKKTYERKSSYESAYRSLIPYLDKIDMDKTSYTYGTVKVDENLQAILQSLMDLSTFEGVDGSWLKLCYFEVHLGSN